MSEAPARHHHFPQLQALRGIAALIVLAHHCLFFYATPSGFRRGSEYAFNAHAAVTVFFVLSGFVLTRALHSNRITKHRLAAYLVRRLTRIYPAVWGGLVIALIFVGWIRTWPSIVPLSQWAVTQEANVVGPREIALTAAGLSAAIIRPMWSIKEELVASLFLIPIFSTLLRGRGALVVSHFVIVLGLVLIAFVADKIAFLYLAEFGIGAALMKTLPAHQPGGRAWQGTTAMSVLAIVAGAVLLFGRTLSAQWRFEPNYDAPIPALIEALAAAVLIQAILTSDRAGNLLGNDRLRRLGDVSYSLYLLHYSVMATASRLLALIPAYHEVPTAMAAIILLAVTASASLPLASLSYQYIEIPGMRLGRALALRLSAEPASLP